MEYDKNYRLALDCAKKNMPMTEEMWALLEELVDKQTKTDVVIGEIGWNKKSNPEDWTYETTYSCSNCDEYLEDNVINYSYCPYCGQALDTSKIPYDD